MTMAPASNDRPGTGCDWRAEEAGLDGMDTEATLLLHLGAKRISTGSDEHEGNRGVEERLGHERCFPGGDGNGERL